MPNVDFLPELLELYPDVKVVLVTRDPTKWWKSIGVNLSYAAPWWLPLFAAPMPAIRWMPSIVHHWSNTAVDLLAKANGPGTPMGPRKRIISARQDQRKVTILLTKPLS